MNSPLIHLIYSSAATHHFTPADLQALLCLRHGATHDEVLDTRRVQGGHCGHEVLDHCRREVVGTNISESAACGFAHCGTVSCYDVCFHLKFRVKSSKFRVENAQARVLSSKFRLVKQL